MIFALAKISSVIFDFNSRSLSEIDFFEICRRENIEVVFDEMPILQGFTVKANGQNYIFLDRNLSGTRFLYTAFHELAHYFLHEPTNKVQVRFYSLARPSREDDEADAAALVCLFPKTILAKTDRKDLSEFENELFEKRLKIYEKFDE